MFYPLVICNIAIDNGDLQWILPFKMTIFNSYFDITRGYSLLGDDHWDFDLYSCDFEGIHSLIRYPLVI